MHCDNSNPHDKHEYQRLFNKLVGRKLSFDSRLVTCPGVAPTKLSPEDAETLRAAPAPKRNESVPLAEIEDVPAPDFLDGYYDDFNLAAEILKHQIARLAKMIAEETDEYDKALLLAIKAQFTEKRWALRPGDSEGIRKIIYPNKGNRK